jgi:formic-like protein
MKFINIVVHSAEDMNFRVHLQYEFTILGLDEFLSNKLRLNDNEKLQMEIQVYLDNRLDVQELVEDAAQKIIKEKELEDLNQELLAENYKFNDALNKITELQKQNET